MKTIRWHSSLSASLVILLFSACQGSSNTTSSGTSAGIGTSTGVSTGGGTTGGTSAGIGTSAGTSTGGSATGGSTTGLPGTSSAGSSTGAQCPVPPACAVGDQACALDGTLVTCADGSNGCPSFMASGTSCATGLACEALDAGVAGCVCPSRDPSDPVYWVDSVHGQDSAPVQPNGLSSPAECRLGTLTHALALVAPLAAGDGGFVDGGRIIVEATGYDFDAGQLVLFTESDGGNSEQFPLIIPSETTLTSDEGDAGELYDIRFNDPVASSVLQLSGTAHFQTFEVDTGPGANTSATALFCDAGTVVIDGVAIVEGSSELANGIDFEGSCAGSMQDVHLSGFTGIGLQLNTSNPVATTLSGNQPTITQIDRGIVVESGALTADGLVIASAKTVGLEISAGAAVTLTNVGIFGSGLEGDAGVAIQSAGALDFEGQIAGVGGAGIVETAGQLTLEADGGIVGTGTRDSSAAGIAIHGGTASLPTGPFTVQAGLGPGVVVDSNGSFSGTALVIEDVSGDGLVVSTDAGVTLTDAAISNNSGRGVYLTSGQLVLLGGTVSDNGGPSSSPGILVSGLMGSASPASLVLVSDPSSSGVTISGNGGDGAQILGGSATIVGATIEENTGAGVEITNGNSNGNSAFSVVLPNDTISSNATGILVHQAEGMGEPVSVSGTAITSNTGWGVALVGDVGNVAFQLAGCSVSNNAGGGLSISEGNGFTTSETLAGDDISANGTSGVANTAGVVFATSSNLGSFQENTVHGNQGDQVLFLADSNDGGWSLDQGSCGPPPTEIWCYQGTGFGVNVQASTAVDVGHIVWPSNGAPVSGSDTNTIAGGSVTNTDLPNACTLTNALVCP